jgi:hypothetical protein
VLTVQHITEVKVPTPLHVNLAFVRVLMGIWLVTVFLKQFFKKFADKYDLFNIL